MNNIKYWQKKGFIRYAEIFVSDRLLQGVDVNIFDKKLDNKLRKHKKAGVYLLVDPTTEEVLKVGQSADIRHRINTQYKCISNSTNNFIREEIKKRWSRIEFFVYLVPNKKIELIGHTFKTNFQKGLEEAILAEYHETYHEIPQLNRQRN
tara:strand:+ start:988 stop:1437 length:450 start_codon:yes stop_codon:yes gene_type:complete